MMLSIASIVSLAFGVIALISNHKAPRNIVYFLLSALVSTWFELVSRGAAAATNPAEGDTYFFWYRINAAVAALFPWTLTLLLIATKQGKLPNPKKALPPSPWLAVCTLLVFLSFSKTFIIPSGGPERHERGLAYVVYGSIECLSYLYITIMSWIAARRSMGLYRTELQFLATSLTISGAGVLAAISGNLLHIPHLRALALFFVLGGFLLFGWSISTRRIYRPIYLLAIITLFLALIFFLYYLFARFSLQLEKRTGQPLELVLQLSMHLLLAILFLAVIYKFIGASYERIFASLRRATVQADRTEPNPHRLIHCLEAHMSHVCEAISATLLFEHGRVFGGGKIQLAKDWSAYSALCELGWATPEGLERRRRSAGADDLREFLAEHSLGLMTTVPRGSTTPTLIVALGTKTSGWPFTYPEIQRIQNVAELMDSVVARSRLAMQAAQNAKIEHLAMMSRGLAHDLKNLITPISTFLLHSNDRQFPVDSDEAQVHAAARRSVDIMTEYVREAIFFSERLAPKREAFDVGHVLREVRAVTEARAASREIRLVTESEFSAPVVSDAVLLQRTLVNLVANAIDASPRGGTVRLAACCSTAGGLLLQVSDHGCGISADHLGHIFDPYFTTKDHGDDVRGFGLGLTICQKIVHVLEGTISVESVVNRGTTVNVELPPASIACA